MRLAIPRGVRFVFDNAQPSLHAEPCTQAALWLAEGGFARLARLERVQPAAQGRAVIERELGIRLSDTFSEFSLEPIAAASIGQVYRGTLTLALSLTLSLTLTLTLTLSLSQPLS